MNSLTWVGIHRLNPWNHLTSFTKFKHMRFLRLLQLIMGPWGMSRVIFKSQGIRVATWIPLPLLMSPIKISFSIPFFHPLNQHGKIGTPISKKNPIQFPLNVRSILLDRNLKLHELHELWNLCDIPHCPIASCHHPACETFTTKQSSWISEPTDSARILGMRRGMQRPGDPWEISEKIPGETTNDFGCLR